MRTLIAVIAAATLCFCIGCGSSNNTTSNSFDGAWTANIPATTTPTDTTAPSTAPVGPQMELSFTLSTPTPGGGDTNAPETEAPQGNLAVSNFQPSTANGCFDSAALVTANGSPSTSITKVMIITITENDNMLTMNAALAPDGNTAAGNFNLNGATPGCMSGSGSVSLTRNSSGTQTPTTGTTNP